MIANRKITIQTAAAMLAERGIEMTHHETSPETNWESFYAVSADDKLAIVPARDIVDYLNGTLETLF